MVQHCHDDYTPRQPRSTSLPTLDPNARSPSLPTLCTQTHPPGRIVRPGHSHPIYCSNTIPSCQSNYYIFISYQTTKSFIEIITTTLWTPNSLPHYIYILYLSYSYPLFLTFTPFPTIFTYIFSFAFIQLLHPSSFSLHMGNLLLISNFINCPIFQPYTIMLQCYYMLSN